jgi:uncharacterized protein
VAPLLWILALVLIAVGIAGTVLPALPGPVLVFAGIVAGAWAGGFERVGPAILILLGLLTVLTYVVDLAATALGVRRSGASNRAVAGTLIGMLAGLPFGLPGLLIGPFAGALVAELTVRNDLRKASQAGLGAWLGFLIGSIVKLALVFTMLGIFLGALFLF